MSNSGGCKRALKSLCAGDGEPAPGPLPKTHQLGSIVDDFPVEQNHKGWQVSHIPPAFPERQRPCACKVFGGPHVKALTLIFPQVNIDQMWERIVMHAMHLVLTPPPSDLILSRYAPTVMNELFDLPPTRNPPPFLFMPRHDQQSNAALQAHSSAISG